MRKLYIKNWLYISLIFSILVLNNSCKKYKQTIVIGRLVNLPLNRGIPNAVFVLKSYSEGGFLLPDKAQIEMTATTDKDGYFKFTFEAYTPYKENKRPSYGVELVTLPENKTFITQYSGSGESNTVRLDIYYGENLLPVKHIGKLGAKNEFTINIVCPGRLKILAYNEDLPISSSDMLIIEFINQFGKFKYGGIYGTETTINENFYVPGIFPGETTIRATITKNGHVEVRDTTFFVEDKEYNLVYRY